MWKNSNVILVSFKVGIGNVIIMYKTEKKPIMGVKYIQQKNTKNTKPPHLVVRQTQEAEKRGVHKESTKLVH